LQGIPVVTATRKDDSELVALAAAGDPAAQRLLVERLRRRVGTVSLAILGNPHDAEDAVQSILLEILRSAASFRGDSLLAWSDRIAVRMAMHQARERRVRSARRAEDEVEAVPATDPARLGSQAIPRPVQEYLAELPEARRTALVLRHVMDYSIDEIAELTGVSPNTVKDRLLQGREQMRRRIRQDLFVTSARTGSRS
jgi:RNA polymerase sigma factor (sigma-70 family)